MSSSTMPQPTSLGRWTRLSDLVLPLGMIAAVLVIMAPVPAGLMDVLLASNITVAVIMLLTTLYVRTPLEFSVFPSLLLVTTLFRLVLNVATTRLILTHAGTDGLMAAGGVVRTFGEFVTGGATGADKIVVGLIIFSIIVLIQFIVITKGATRISEVAARFTLDGMPGKQMAIDADLAAGAIDQQEAQRRRREVAAQADFFGAMDGASKFVRGDAIAGIIIILINIVGGLVIGVAENGMSLAQAGSLFTTLTIGDGLVTQVPALLISLAAGMLVTRSHQESNLPNEFLRQLFLRPQALAVAGGFLGVLIFTSLPRIPLLLLGVGCITLAIAISKRDAQMQSVKAKKQAEVSRRAGRRVEDFLTVDPMELELGVGLIRIADPNRGGVLLERIQQARQNLAADIGIILPKVRVRDNMRLEQNQYRIKIADVAVAQGTIDAKTLDPANTIAAHLSDTAGRHADELLTRDAVRHLVDELRRTSPAAVDELIPGLMKLGEVQRVLQMLLVEGVPIRQLGAILETLSDTAPRVKDPIQLTELVRRRLAATICRRFCDRGNRLYVVTLDPAFEERILAGCDYNEEGLTVRLTPDEAEEVRREIERGARDLAAIGREPIVLTSPKVRPLLKQFTAAHMPQLIVLSYNEITRDMKIESVAMVGAASAVAA